MFSTFRPPSVIIYIVKAIGKNSTVEALGILSEHVAITHVACVFRKSHIIFSSFLRLISFFILIIEQKRPTVK